MMDSVLMLDERRRGAGLGLRDCRRVAEQKENSISIPPIKLFIPLA